MTDPRGIRTVDTNANGPNLYVIFDVFSRKAVGWMFTGPKPAPLDERMFAATFTGASQS